MLIVLAIAGAGAVIGYCWFSLSRSKDAINDVAGRARETHERRRLRNGVEDASLTAIDDPGTAAVVMAVAVASRNGRLGVREEDKLRQMMDIVLDVAIPDEELIFAKQVVRQNSDPDNVSQRLGKLWTARLTMDEREDLLDFIHNVAAAGGPLTSLQVGAIDRLQARLRVEPAH